MLSKPETECETYKTAEKMNEQLKLYMDNEDVQEY